MPDPSGAVVTVESNPCWCKPVRLDADSRCTTCGHVWTDCAAADKAAATTETVVLPVTGETVPAEAAALTVKPLGEMKSRDGVAFRAEVRHGSTVLGSIEQDGNGGGTYMYPVSAAAREEWDRLVDAHAAIDADHALIAEENLANTLYEEVALARDLNRKRNLIVRVDNDSRDEWDDDKHLILTINVPRTAPAARLAAVTAKIAADYAGRNPAMWVKGQGWEVLSS